MRPPLCAVCGSTPSDSDTDERAGSFRVVEFSDYQPPEETIPGGPWPGSDWFCRDHVVGAERAATEGMTLKEALRSLTPP